MKKTSPTSTKRALLPSLGRQDDTVRSLPLDPEAQSKVTAGPASNRALQQMAEVMPDLFGQLQMPVLMASSQRNNKQRYFFLACHSPETLFNKYVLG